MISLLQKTIKQVRINKKLYHASLLIQLPKDRMQNGTYLLQLAVRPVPIAPNHKLP